jgi:hypothetical protein
MNHFKRNLLPAALVARAGPRWRMHRPGQGSAIEGIGVVEEEGKQDRRQRETGAGALRASLSLILI